MMLDQAPSSGERAEGPARLHRVGVQALVEQLIKARKVEDGCVTVIGLDAIRERLGDRWPRRSAQVWEAVDRLLERRLPPHALHARIDEVDYLIEAGVSAADAEATSFKLLQELHLFFLGEPMLSAMRVESVLSFDGERPLTRQVTGRSFSPPEGAPAQRLAAPEPEGAGRWSALSFVQAGHRLQVAYERQGVVLLSSGRPMAVRLRPIVQIDGVLHPGATVGEGLTHAELMALDQATMREAMSVGDGPIVAPFFFETLSNTRGRAAILETLGGRTGPRGLIGELVGIDRGTPTSRIVETIGLVSPYCAGLVIQSPTGRPSVAAIEGTRLKGRSIDCEAAARHGVGAAARLAEAKARGGVGPLLFAFGLPSVGMLPLARAAGATHASLATSAAT